MHCERKSESISQINKNFEKNSIYNETLDKLEEIYLIDELDDKLKQEFNICFMKTMLIALT